MKCVSRHEGDFSAATLAYVSTIWRLVQFGGEVRSIRIGEVLGVSRPSVCLAMRRLEKLGLIYRAEDKSIVLTRKGRTVGEEVVWRQEVLYAFLTGSLESDPCAAWAEARGLASSMSNETCAALWGWLRLSREKTAS